VGIYDDTIERFTRAVKDKELLNDVGIMELIKTVAFSQEYRQNIELLAMAEVINPTSETSLLLRLSNEQGYVKLQSPQHIRFKVKSSEHLTLKIDTQLTSGNKLFLLREEGHLVNGIETELTASREFLKTREVKISSEQYTEVDLGTSYQEITRVVSESLILSQNFVKDDSNAMYRVDENGQVWCIIKNSQFKEGEVIHLKIYTTVPDSLSIVGYLNIIDINLKSDIIFSDIKTVSSPIPPMTTKEMRETLLYHRNPLGDIVTNQSYRDLILSNLNIDNIKIWFEKEESKESGFKSSNINKVFISYISNEHLDDAIEELILTRVRDKAIVFRKPSIKVIKVTVGLTNYNPVPINESTFYSFKNSIHGIKNRLERVSINRAIDTFYGRDVDTSVSFDVADATGSLNEFYSIEVDNIDIKVSNASIV